MLGKLLLFISYAIVYLGYSIPWALGGIVIASGVTRMFCPSSLDTFLASPHLTIYVMGCLGYMWGPAGVFLIWALSLFGVVLAVTSIWTLANRTIRGHQAEKRARQMMLDEVETEAYVKSYANRILRR